jgi:GDP-L-fucose synthase
MDKSAKIYIAGHRGLVGSAILRRLEKEGYSNFVLRTHAELDLLDQKATADFFAKEKPEYVFLAAAKVGGIMANSTYPADFIHSNLQVQNNVVHQSYLNKVKKLLFLGSSCIYPKLCPQPIKEEYLLTGVLEPTNEPYAVAKIAGTKMCQSYNRQYKTNFISVMPTNLYGPNDNFDLNNSHVLPALIRKFHDAKIENKGFVELWGTGTAKREFLHINDLAAACVFLMNNYDGSEIINIGSGGETSIKDLAELIKKIVGFEGEVRWDAGKPDGTPRKLLDVSKINKLGWKHEIKLEDGIRSTYGCFVENYKKITFKSMQIIEKPWGQEEILETNPQYTVKRLLMKKGCQCSYQYHEKKRETIYCLKGRLYIIGEKTVKALLPGGSITIPPFEKHRMRAVEEDAVYLESSTSELDDVVRISDDYGRS